MYNPFSDLPHTMILKNDLFYIMTVETFRRGIKRPSTGHLCCFTMLDALTVVYRGDGRSNICSDWW